MHINAHKPKPKPSPILSKGPLNKRTKIIGEPAMAIGTYFGRLAIAIAILAVSSEFPSKIFHACMNLQIIYPERMSDAKKNTTCIHENTGFPS